MYLKHLIIALSLSNIILNWFKDIIEVYLASTEPNHFVVFSLSCFLFDS